MEQESKSLKRILAETAISVAYLLAAAWAMAPEHTRSLWGMRASSTAGRLLEKAARRAGRAGMAAELRAGRPVSEHYQLPYLLSCARDACARAYERFRGGVA